MQRSQRRLVEERRAVRVHDRRRGAADRGRGRRALSRRARRDASVGSARRVPRDDGPETASAAARSALGARARAVHDGRGDRPFRRETSNTSCAPWRREELLVRGELRPGGTEREWCDPDVLRRLRRASLAALRKEVEPAEQAAFARSCPPGTASTGVRACEKRSCRCRRLHCRSRCGSPTCCPRRVPDYRPRAARPALRHGRGRLDRRRPRPRRRVLPR